MEAFCISNSAQISSLGGRRKKTGHGDAHVGQRRIQSVNDANFDFMRRIFKEAERWMEHAERHRTMRRNLHLVHNSVVVLPFSML